MLAPCPFEATGRACTFLHLRAAEWSFESPCYCVARDLHWFFPHAPRGAVAVQGNALAGAPHGVGARKPSRASAVPSEAAVWYALCFVRSKLTEREES